MSGGSSMPEGGEGSLTNQQAIDEGHERPMSTAASALITW